MKKLEHRFPIAPAFAVALCFALTALPTEAQVNPYVTAIQVYLERNFHSTPADVSGIAAAHVVTVDTCPANRRCYTSQAAALVTFTEGDGAGQALVFVTQDMFNQKLSLQRSYLRGWCHWG